MSSSFNKTAIADLPPRAKRFSIQDPKTPGLSLMVYPTGKKVYVLRRRIEGRSERIRVGSFYDLSIEQARKIASQYNARIGAGENPYSEIKEKRQELTFKELFDRYYREYALLQTKDPEANKKMMECHVFPYIGNRKLSKIDKEAARKIFFTIAEKRRPGTAARVMQVVKAVFNHGIKHEYFNGTNPCVGLPTVKIASRDRFLSNEELKAFFEAVNQEEELFRDFFLLLLYTGARKSNVLSMAWKDIRFDLRQWRIPESLTKNKDVNIVNLSDSALEILSRRHKSNNDLSEPSAYIFPGIGKEGHLNDPKKAFERIRKRMQVEDFRMHDLRRTLGSYMAISGSSLLTIGKALNHKSTRSTEIYARLSQAAVLEAVNQASQLINGR